MENRWHGKDPWYDRLVRLQLGRMVAWRIRRHDDSVHAVDRWCRRGDVYRAPDSERFLLVSDAVIVQEFDPASANEIARIPLTHARFEHDEKTIVGASVVRLCDRRVVRWLRRAWQRAASGAGLDIHKGPGKCDGG